MKLFHGTTLNKLLNVIKEGYLGSERTVWNISEPNTTYFYSEEKLKEDFDFDGNEWFEFGIRRALESANITLGTERKELRRVVLVLNSEDLEKIGKVEIDSSCGITEFTDTCEFKGRIPIDLIKEIWIDQENRDYLLMYFVGLSHFCSTDRPYKVTDYREDLDSEMLDASIKVFEALQYWFMENLDFMEVLEEITIEKLKRRYGIKET